MIVSWLSVAALLLIVAATDADINQKKTKNTDQDNLPQNKTKGSDVNGTGTYKVEERPNQPSPADAGIDVNAIVAYEEFTARKYVELLLNLQGSYLLRRGCGSILQTYMTDRRNSGVLKDPAVQAMSLEETLGKFDDVDPDADNVEKEDNSAIDVPDSDMGRGDEDSDADGGDKNDDPVDRADENYDIQDSELVAKKSAELNTFATENEDDFKSGETSFLEMESGESRKRQRMGHTKQNKIVHALAILDIFTFVKIQTLQAVMDAADLQKEFFINRALQLKLMSLGTSLPPEYAKLMYIRMFKTFISTQRLSARFEVVSTWTTWLENELGHILEQTRPTRTIPEDLLIDRRFAFNSFNRMTQLGWGEFILDSYLEYAIGSLPGVQGTGTAAGSSSSFLEVDSQTKFIPTALMFTGHTYYALKLYKMYSLYYMSAAASSGLQSTYVPNKKLANALFVVGVSNNLINAANIQLATCAWEFYNILSPMLSQSPNQPSPSTPGPTPSS